MRLTQDVMDLADRFFDQLRQRGATDELIADLAMTLVSMKAPTLTTQPVWTVIRVNSPPARY